MTDNQNQEFGTNWVLTPEEFSNLDSLQTELRKRFQFSSPIYDPAELDGVPENKIWTLVGDVDEEMPYDGMTGVFAWLEPSHTFSVDGWAVRGWLVAEVPRTSEESRLPLNVSIICPECDGEQSENIGNEGSCEECEGWGTRWADDSDPSGWFDLE